MAMYDPLGSFSTDLRPSPFDSYLQPAPRPDPRMAGVYGPAFSTDLGRGPLGGPPPEPTTSRGVHGPEFSTDLGETPAADAESTFWEDFNTVMGEVGLGIADTLDEMHASARVAPTISGFRRGPGSGFTPTQNPGLEALSGYARFFAGAGR